MRRHFTKSCTKTANKPLGNSATNTRTEGIRSVARDCKELRSVSIRAKNVQHFDDILRTFINDTNKFVNSFGIIKNEEKMLAVKKLMLESLLICRFRGTTMSYDELLIALENIIVDKVATVPTARNRKIDTSAPVEIGMAAKDDSEHMREEWVPANRGSHVASCLQRNRQRKIEFWTGSELE